MGVIGSQDGRGPVMVLTAESKVDMATIIDSSVKAAIRTVLTHIDLWYCLVNHRVPRSEIDSKPTKFLLDLYKQKSSRLSEQKSSLSHKNRVMGP